MFDKKIDILDCEPLLVHPPPTYYMRDCKSLFIVLHSRFLGTMMVASRERPRERSLIPKGVENLFTPNT